MSGSRGSFQRWKEKVNEKVNTLGSKTSYAMDRAKARKQITQIQEEITLLKQEIGDTVFNNRNHVFTFELVEVQLGQIKEKENAIVQLESYIEELNELSRLAGLKVEEDTSVTFKSLDESQQPFSDEIVEVEQKAPITEPFTCPNCQQSYEEPKKFCKKCGHKMVD